MDVVIQPVPGGGPPDFLVTGHITRDLHDDGSFSLGGTATFASMTAYHLGVRAAIVTSAGRELIAELPACLPGIGLAVCPSEQTTTFVNSYHDGSRTQYLKSRADQQQPEDVPPAWRRAPIVLLGPVAQELSPAFVTLFSRRPGTLIAATPQGWLRRWDATASLVPQAGRPERMSRVWPTPWTAAGQVLPHLDVLILSYDDMLPFANGNRVKADALLSRWNLQVPLLVATDGRHGATLFQHSISEHFPAYPAQEVDPTGAGDVFAAAFLYHLHRYGDPRAAVNFANCVASFSVEHEGTTGIPTLEMVKERLR